MEVVNRALLTVLGSSNLTLELMRYSKAQMMVVSEKQQDALHSLSVILQNVDRALHLLLATSTSNNSDAAAVQQQQQQLFVWMYKQNALAVLSAMQAVVSNPNLCAKAMSFISRLKSPPAELELALLPIITLGFLEKEKAPTRTLLLARDWTHHVVWKHNRRRQRCGNGESLGNDDVLVDAFTCALEREVAWLRGGGTQSSAPQVLVAAMTDVLHSAKTDRALPEEEDVLLLVAERRRRSTTTTAQWDAVIAALSDVALSPRDVHHNLLLGTLLVMEDNARLKQLLPFAVKCLGSVGLPRHTHTLAGALLRTLSVGGENSADVQAALVPLVLDGEGEDEDGVSAAAVELLVESATQRQRTDDGNNNNKNVAALLHELEVRLAAPHKAKNNKLSSRDVALRVLTRVLESRLSAAAAAGEDADDEATSWELKLFDLLLKQLGDAGDIKHRQLASQYVARVVLASSIVHVTSKREAWQSRALIKLCSLLIQQADVAALASAASEALVLVFAQMDAVSSAHLLRVLMLNVDGGGVQDAAFDLTQRWLTARFQTTNAASPVFSIETVLDACCDNAQSRPQLFGFARRIAAFLVRQQAAAAQKLLLARWLTHVQLKLSSSSSPQPTEVVVVDRLAPFLLLKMFSPVLPVDCLEEEEDKALLVRQLCSSMSDPSEFGPVRQVAVELLAGLTATGSVLPWQVFLSILDDAEWAKLDELVPGGWWLEAEEGDASSSSFAKLGKTALYGCCQAVAGCMARGEFGPSAFPAAVVAPLVLQCVQQRQLSTSADSVKMLEGVSEYFVLAVCCESVLQWEAEGAKVVAASSTSSPVVIVEEEEEEGQEGGGEAGASLAAMLKCLFPPLSSSAASRTEQDLARHVLCEVAKSFLPRPPTGGGGGGGGDGKSLSGASLRSSLPAHRVHAASVGCCKMLLAQLSAAYTTSSSPSRRSAFYHVVFTLCFVNMKVAPQQSALSAFELNWLVNCALEDLTRCDAASVVQEEVGDDDGDELKPLVLRLVGILLAFPTALLSQLADGTLGRIQAKLRGIANLDASHDARLLAREILKSFDNGGGKS